MNRRPPRPREPARGATWTRHEPGAQLIGAAPCLRGAVESKYRCPEVSSGASAEPTAVITKGCVGAQPDRQEGCDTLRLNDCKNNARHISSTYTVQTPRSVDSTELDHSQRLARRPKQSQNFPANE